MDRSGGLQGSAQGVTRQRGAEGVSCPPPYESLRRALVEDSDGTRGPAAQTQNDAARSTLSYFPCLTVR